MESLTKVKAIFITLGTALAAWLGMLAVPVYILVLLNIIDYFTALAAAPYRGQKRNSSAGIKGIVKKVCMWMLVVLGAVMDWLVLHITQTLGFSLPFEFIIAFAVAVWLICNEIISILENIGDTGISLPPFLSRMVLWVQQVTEEKANKAAEALEKMKGDKPNE